MQLSSNPIVSGALGGAAAGLLVWGLTNFVIQKKLGKVLQTEVPPLIRAELDRKLAEYNITPDTGRQVARVLDQADRWGLI